MSEMETLRAELRELRAQVVASHELLLRVLEKRGSEARVEQMMFSLSEAATILGVSSKSVGRMVARGELMTVAILGARRIPIEEIDRHRQPKLAKSNASPQAKERVRFDRAAAERRMAELRKKRRERDER